MAKNERRKFTTEFKNEATKLVLDQKMSVARVCEELALQESVLRRWIQQAKIDLGQGPSAALTTEERNELAQLRRENKRLKLEHEILKKAAAFFAKETR